MIQTVEITDMHRALAKTWFKPRDGAKVNEDGSIIMRGSFTNGKYNTHGALAEIAVLQYLQNRGYNIRYVGDNDCDIIVNGHRADVKSKICNSKPLITFNCAVPYRSFDVKKTDSYIFARVMKNMSFVYILGEITKDQFIKKSKLFYKGQSDIDGYYFHQDTYVIPATQLNSL